MNKNQQDVFDGCVAVVSTAAGTTVSILSTVEAWLRVTSLMVGISVGVLSGMAIWRRRNDK